MKLLEPLLWVVAGTSPALVAVASLFADSPPVGFRLTVGWSFVLLAAMVALLNFYLSFPRGWLYRLRHGSMADYRFASGLPLVGSIGALVGASLAFGSVPVALVALTTLILDTAGSLWVLPELLREFGPKRNTERGGDV